MFTKKYLILLAVASFLLTTIGLAMAQTTAQTITAPQETITTPTTNSVVLACVKAAVDKRETAIGTAFDTFSGSIKSALQTRKSELLVAWDIANRNERRVAIKNAWNKFFQTKRSAVRTFNQARLGAWTQFIKDRKACGALPTGENPGADLSF